jgi:hypothetical protein
VKRVRGAPGVTAAFVTGGSRQIPPTGADALAANRGLEHDALLLAGEDGGSLVGLRRRLGG